MCPVLRPFLVVLILLSAAISGAAGGDFAFAGTQMVICGAEGARTIWLGPDGTPTEKPMACGDCPDCTLSAAGTAPDPVVVERSMGRTIALWWMALDSTTPVSHWPAGLSRGPPPSATTGIFR